MEENIRFKIGERGYDHSNSNFHRAMGYTKEESDALIDKINPIIFNADNLSEMIEKIEIDESLELRDKLFLVSIIMRVHGSKERD